ncbi:HNH endonuclease, partial [Promicromonospora sp. NPDC060204]
HGGWNVTRDPDTGNTTWTAPTGHTHTRPPTQIGNVSNDVTSLADDTRHRLGSQAPSAARQLNKKGGSAVTESRVLPGEPPF